MTTTMRRRSAVTAVLGAAVATAVLTAPAPALASETAAGPCSPNTLCVFYPPNEGGTGYSVTRYPVGTCIRFTAGGYESYRNNSTIEGYFFETTGCGGRAKTVYRNSGGDNMGFRAYSFRFACVSC
ncbi:hypothetical protein J2S43_001831 [Catenuloplanes nepalensis]|uniref:Peptidase inhibitor family I36 n=1 Tax=Catenuloplanes nepalensis TaxID=587533 RepID=A0ABT9MPF7_9ACTN|nr:peptidase inhibitor family I36 protein [Catenuloplanes nepalensis]MDP9793319.1 hypothetical protein [Catenuloplanes nepalensis]